MRKCSGAIITRRKKGKVQILMVRSSTNGNWIHPKGGIERNLTSAESAAKEVYEEAGIVGALANHLGTIKCSIRGQSTLIEYFHLKCAVVLRRYPESSTRRRKWFSVEKALKLTKKSLRPLVEMSIEHA